MLGAESRRTRRLPFTPSARRQSPLPPSMEVLSTGTPRKLEGKITAQQQIVPDDRELG